MPPIRRAADGRAVTLVAGGITGPVRRQQHRLLGHRPAGALTAAAVYGAGHLRKDVAAPIVHRRETEVTRAGTGGQFNGIAQVGQPSGLGIQPVAQHQIPAQIADVQNSMVPLGIVDMRIRLPPEIPRPLGPGPLNVLGHDRGNAVAVQGKHGQRAAGVVGDGQIPPRFIQGQMARIGAAGAQPRGNCRRPAVQPQRYHVSLGRLLLHGVEDAAIGVGQQPGGIVDAFQRPEVPEGAAGRVRGHFPDAFGVTADVEPPLHGVTAWATAVPSRHSGRPCRSALPACPAGSGRRPPAG